MIPPLVLRILVSGLLAFALGRLTIKDKGKRKTIESTLLNGIWTYFLGVKGSLLFTHLSSISQEPLLLLYGWGGPLNRSVGIVLTLAYFTWFIWKKSTEKKRHLTFTLVVLSSFGGMFLLSGLLNRPTAGTGHLVLEDLTQLTAVDGRSLDLAQDKVTILNFWATWCTPCRAEMPELEVFHRQYPDANFVTINNITSEKGGINSVREFLASRDYSFPVIADEGSRLTSQFEVNSFPTTLVFDKQGELIDKHVGVISLSALEGFLSH